MRRVSQRLTAFLIVSLLILRAQVAQAAEFITYEVSPDAAARQYAVVLTVPRVQGPTLRVQIPTWSPGAYVIGNYAASIKEVTAQTAVGETLNVVQPDKLTWEVQTNGAKTVRIYYRVDRVDLEVVDGKPKRGHLSGPRTFMYVVDRKQEPVRLILRVPADWKVANSLDAVPGKEPNIFEAPNYDVLADAPSEMGDYAEENFEARGVPHKIVLYGDHAHVDRARLLDICTRVAESQIAFFNHAPFKRYTFMFRVGGPRGRGAGGLEHLGSTEIGFSGPVGDSVRSVTAHEYFHAWNVKRIRPRALGPFDYTGPNRTVNLWWSEGVTSYYGDLLSRRAGLINDTEYLKHLADTISLLQNNPARLRVTAEESSYRVWDGGGSQGYGRLSYYTKGELIGLCLDLTIRRVTDNRKSLDDVMRALYAQCGRGGKPGFAEDDIRKAVNRVSGTDLSALYDRLCRSVEEMPFAEVLSYAGLALTASGRVTVTPDLGMFATPDREANGLRVRFVTAEGPAERAGLKQDDLIREINGKPALATDAPPLTTQPPDTELKLTVERGGQTQEIRYTVGRNERKQWTIAPLPSPTDAQARLYSAWLNGG